MYLFAASGLRSLVILCGLFALLLTGTAYAQLSFEVTQGTCASPTASLTIITPVNNTGRIRYRLDNAPYQREITFNNVAAGTHNVYYAIVDADDVITFESEPRTVTIDPLPIPVAPFTTDITQPTCASARGSLTVTIAPNLTHTFRLNAGTSQTSPVFPNLTQGNYTLRISSVDNSCSATSSFTINRPLVVPTVTSAIAPSCNPDPFGLINISATNATGYSINNGQNYTPFNVFEILRNGTYQVRVQSADGCESDATEVVIFNSPQNPEDITPEANKRIRPNTSTTLTFKSPSITNNSGQAYVFLASEPADLYTGQMLTSDENGVFTYTTPPLTASAVVQVQYLYYSSGGGRECSSNGVLLTMNIEVDNTLPVELMAFRGTATGGGNQLTWQTASERNNAGFQLEYSPTTASGFAWQPVGFVAGRGTTLERQTYSYFHELPAGVGAYYRLKQVDTDGKFTYSQVIYLKGGESNSLMAYPNPGNGLFTVVGLNTETPVDVFSQTGQLVTAPFTNNQLDLRASPAGVYILAIPGQGRNLKLIKQ